MENRAFTHVLQKKGILKNFSVAKVVKKKDIEDLKKLVREMTSSEEEYKRILKEELAKISDMHDNGNPVPGIIYVTDDVSAKRNLIFAISEKIARGIKTHKFTKQEMALLISSIISKLDLDQEDFMKLNEELGEELGEDIDDDDFEEGESEF